MPSAIRFCTPLSAVNENDPPFIVCCRNSIFCYIDITVEFLRKRAGSHDPALRDKFILHLCHFPRLPEQEAVRPARSANAYNSERRKSSS